MSNSECDLYEDVLIIYVFSSRLVREAMDDFCGVNNGFRILSEVGGGVIAILSAHCFSYRCT